MAMPSTDGPRVPRDEAFWNTYHDVRKEEAAAEARAQCLARGHALLNQRGTVSCPDCGADLEQICADFAAAGYTVVRTEEGVSISFET